MSENLEKGLPPTQSLEDINDDVVELLDASAPVSTPGTTSTVNRGSTRGKSARDDDSENVDREAKKSKSEVWKYFDRVGIVDGVEKCRCKHCRCLYTCKVESGTTHLKRHAKKCFKTPEYHDVSALLDNKATLLKKWKFDTKAYREVLARAIIKHDLPFNYAEYDVNAVNKVLNPEFKPTSRNTIKDDCLAVYHSEKNKLKNLLVAHSGRICLTSDCWTAVTARGYMSVIAHFIDSNWKLNSKLFSFCELDTPHSGLELSSKLLGVLLKDWGIESKIFSLTLDNASSNDSMVRILKDWLNLQDGLLCQGEFFHVRCWAHILNLIVQEGLKALDDALKRIRNSVKYVRGSDGRLRDFLKCIEEVNLSGVGGAFLKLDVSTRWNSTYMMLESAIKYRCAFTSLSYNDTNYKFCPTNEEWDRAEKITTLLAPFFEITKLISRSSYPTSSLYFTQVARIEMKLHEFLNCEDEVIKEMAKRMKVKFDKYWDSYSTTLALGNVLDPKRKLRYLTFVYKRLYPDKHEEKVKIVKDALYKLFAAYERDGVASHSNITPLSSSSSMHMSHANIDEYDLEFLQESSNEGKSELDVYLDESLGPPGVVNALDAIEYWKINAQRFPQLARMTSDILSIPITTVASEFTFSIGGRILHKYRSCLLPKNVQALICTRNWLHGFEVDENFGAQEVEEIQLSKQDSNVVDV